MSNKVKTILVKSDGYEQDWIRVTLTGLSCLMEDSLGNHITYDEPITMRKIVQVYGKDKARLVIEALDQLVTELKT